MNRLDLPDLLALACEVTGGSAGDVVQVLDTGAAERALDHAQRRRTPAGSHTTVHDTAALLLHELLAADLLAKGGRRLALLAMLQFLRINGLCVELRPPEAAYRILAAVCSGAADLRQIGAWIDERLLPAEQATSTLVERLSPSARRVVERAAADARTARRMLGADHLFLALVQNDEATQAAMGDVSSTALREAIGPRDDEPSWADQGAAHGSPLSVEGGSVLAWAGVAARQAGRQNIACHDLLSGVLRAGTTVSRALVLLGVDVLRMQRVARAPEGTKVVGRTSGARSGPKPVSLSARLHESGGTPLRRDRALDELRQRVHRQVIDSLGRVVSDGTMSDLELRRRAEDEIRTLLAGAEAPMSLADRETLTRDLVDDVVGYGPIDRYLQDPDVSEVMVNGPHDVYVERFGKLERVDASFVDASHLRRIVDRIVGQVGRRVDESAPMVDARLPDGSRVNAVVHPLAVGGPFLTIRRFSPDVLNIDDLLAVGTLDERTATFLDACVRGRLNIAVSGGTGTGKTTLLNVLSSFIPDEQRIVVLEDAKELRLRQPHVLYLEARPPNIEARGEVTIRELLRNALRMRPDRIVVGECRSGEALDMLQALNTGHDGSLTTVHANSPRDTLSRIETMALMAGVGLPVRAIREQMASALHLLVHLTRSRDGARRVTHVTEVFGMEQDIIVLQDLFVRDWAAGVDEAGGFRGGLKATGIWPQFGRRLGEAGIELPPDMFH
ncbi:MAG: CpaF family protein [Acidimicrobiales bacterium]